MSGPRFITSWYYLMITSTKNFQRKCTILYFVNAQIIVHVCINRCSYCHSYIQQIDAVLSASFSVFRSSRLKKVFEVITNYSLVPLNNNIKCYIAIHTYTCTFRSFWLLVTTWTAAGGEQFMDSNWSLSARWTRNKLLLGESSTCRPMHKIITLQSLEGVFSFYPRLVPNLVSSWVQDFCKTRLRTKGRFLQSLFHNSCSYQTPSLLIASRPSCITSPTW